MTRKFRLLPFTVIMTVALLFVASVTDSDLAALQPLMRRFTGFAPIHLLSSQWYRILTSALVTSGGWTLYWSLTVLIFSVGTVEWYLGTRRACLTFWGVHVATLLAESCLFALPLMLLENPLGIVVTFTRDVGPSAGYYGCLGAALTLPRRRVRWILSAALLTYLLVRLVCSMANYREARIELAADVAHLIAVPLGMISTRFGRRRGIVAGNDARKLDGDVKTIA